MFVAASKSRATVRAGIARSLFRAAGPVELAWRCYVAERLMSPP
jgi:hypothetical protein